MYLAIILFGAKIISYDQAAIIHSCMDISFLRNPQMALGLQKLSTCSHTSPHSKSSLIDLVFSM
jgi:hypothetical protein